MPLFGKRSREKTRCAYLVLLWDTEPWSRSEQEQILRTESAELGCPTKVLKTIRLVDEPLPTTADTYVVALALSLCKMAGISFDNERDQIAFRPGVGRGVIEIEVGG